MENIITWDFMGWRGHNEPEVGLQLKWNKTLIDKIYEISQKILASSLISGADTITMSHSMEGLLHPDVYDNHRKVLNGGIKVIFDDTIDKYVIKIENLKVLENLKLIPKSNMVGEINLVPISDCIEEEIIKYIEGLIGFVIIENLNI